MARGWYVVHTFSGYEQKIEKTLRRMMEINPEFGAACFDVKIPFETHIEMKDGQKKEVKSKLLPGYILLDLDLNEDNWKKACSDVRNINGVTGFLTANIREMPLPISKEEYTEILKQTGEIQGETAFKPRQTFNVGDRVKITEGPFEDFAGTVEETNTEKSRLRVSVEIFGRATPVDVDFSQVEKV